MSPYYIATHWPAPAARRLLACILGVLGMATLAICVFRNKYPNETVKAGLADQVYDFGQERAGQIILHSFVLRNPYDRPLRIDRVVSSCGCTVLLRPLASLASRGQLDVPIRVTLPRGAEDRFESRVVIYFEGGSQTQFMFTGSLVTENPVSVTFMNARRGEAQERRFTLRAYGPESITVRDAVYDKSYIAVSWVPDTANSRDVLVVVRLLPNIPTGPFSLPLQLVTDDRVEPTKNLTVEGYVLRRVEARVSPIVCGLIAPGGEAHESIELYSPYGGNVKVDAAAAEPPETILVDTGNAEPHLGSIVIPVVIRGNFKNEILRGSVDVRVHTGGESLDIPIEVYAMKP
jgi:hypothetical protein